LVKAARWNSTVNIEIFRWTAHEQLQSSFTISNIFTLRSWITYFYSETVVHGVRKIPILYLTKPVQTSLLPVVISIFCFVKSLAFLNHVPCDAYRSLYSETRYRQERSVALAQHSRISITHVNYQESSMWDQIRSLFAILSVLNVLILRKSDRNFFFLNKSWLSKIEGFQVFLLARAWGIT
jgi:hypothetical protein